MLVAVASQSAEVAPIEHGYVAYSRNICRCLEVCTPAAAAYRRQQRAARLAHLKANPRDHAHGKRASYDAGCRCGKCKRGRRLAGVRLGEQASAA